METTPGNNVPCVCVLQVWFQNRRSKERRMKQLSALGARRHFFRNPRRMRALRPGEEDSADMLGPGFGYMAGDFGKLRSSKRLFDWSGFLCLQVMA